jgi:TolB-like protein/DNA-binding winged helix-turn-helix (wHTH) protein
MEEHAGADVARFSGFRFDRSHGCLLRQDKDGTFTPVAVGSRALDLLGLLIDRHGDLVSKDEILNAVWPGVVEGANVTVHISALRRVLDEGRSNGSLIQTVPGRGYRFTAPVIRCEADPLPAAGGNRADRSGDIQPVAPVPTCAPVRQRRWRRLAAISVVLALGVATAWMWKHHWSGAVPPLSMVVLPFANLSSDPDYDYFVDAVTNDLTTDLSRVSGTFVIARGTALTYKGKPTDEKQIGRELGVRYVVEGAVRRDSDQVLVNAALVDAESGAQLWADRFDTDRRSLAKAESEISGRLAKALNVKLIEAAGRRIERELGADPDAHDLYLRGYAQFLRGPHTAATAQEAQRLYERALEMDPESVETRAGIAGMLMTKVGVGSSGSVLEDLGRAEQLLYEALGRCHLLLGRVDQAIDFLRKAYAASPRNGPDLWLGAALGLRGDLDDAKTALVEWLKFHPHVNSLAQARATLPSPINPRYMALREKTVEVGLRRAGFPEE